MVEDDDLTDVVCVVEGERFPAYRCAGGTERVLSWLADLTIIGCGKLRGGR